jgi:hypothetical protein
MTVVRPSKWQRDGLFGGLVRTGRMGSVPPLRW